jgi:hypothetical protein
MASRSGSPSNRKSVKPELVGQWAPRKKKESVRQLTTVGAGSLPPILSGHDTPAIREQVYRFYVFVEELFERWVTRRTSPHTWLKGRGVTAD